MAKLKDVAAFLDERLNIAKFRSDASNNGLQFEGGQDVFKAVFAVDASHALFTTAADLDADFIFVHHGISWGGSLKRILSLDAKRVAMLAANSISLYGAHLPLDAHTEIGHNALLARMMKLENPSPFGEYDSYNIGFQGMLPKEMTVKGLAKLLDGALLSEGPYHIFGDPERKIMRVGAISGGGAYPAVFSELYALGIDCLVTGEMTHEAYHYALEAGVSVLSMGHYRSETPGVDAVMQEVREHFDIETEFLDLPTGL